MQIRPTASISGKNINLYTSAKLMRSPKSQQAESARQETKMN